MRNPQYLTCSQHGAYYFRFPLPAAIHPERKRSDVKVSLGTRCPRAALQVARILGYAGQIALNHRCKSGMEYHLIRDALSQHFKALLEAHQAKISSSGPVSDHDRSITQSSYELATHALASGDDSMLGTGTSIASLSDRLGLPIKPHSPEFPLFRSEFLKAYRDYCQHMLDMNAEQDGYSFAEEPSQLPKPAKRNPMTLAAAIDEYVAERTGLKGWTASSANEYRAKFNLLLRILGSDISLHITDENALNVRRILMKLPARINTMPELRKLTIEELTELQGHPKMQAPTIMKHLRTFSTFYAWAAKRKMTPQNPFTGLVDVVNRPVNERLPYEPAQAAAIIQAALQESKPYRKWGTLIAFYTGARLNEIAQLEASDIVQISEVWCFDINGNTATLTGKKLKSPSAQRTIPIHSRLIDLGFLEFVASMGNGRIFSGLSYNARDGYGRNLGRWFNEVLLPELGMKTTGHVFHGIRHTVAQQLIDNGVEMNVVTHLIGHAAREITTQIYAKKLAVSVKKMAIETLAYPENI